MSGICISLFNRTGCAIHRATETNSCRISNNHEIFFLIGLVGRVFANGPGDLGSIPDRVIPKTLKMVLDTSFLNTQQHKVRIKGKVEQFRERSSALLYTSVLQLLKREPSGPPWLRAPTLLTYFLWLLSSFIKAGTSKIPGFMPPGNFMGLSFIHLHAFILVHVHTSFHCYISFLFNFHINKRYFCI